jgi:predicted metal-dependent hydrolase
MSKTYFHETLGEIVLTKRKSSSHVRLRVKHDGTVAVSLPKWIPYKHALDFIEKRAEWILEQQDNYDTVELTDGMQVGKAHFVKFIGVESARPSSRIKNDQINLYIPDAMDASSTEVLRTATKAITKALKIQTASFLNKRISELAELHRFEYDEMQVGHMKTRWGTCSSAGVITLNCYLMQLPWDLIDYVILHELTHTRIMSHGTPFWNEMEKILPNTSEYRKSIKKYHPSIVFV